MKLSPNEYEILTIIKKVTERTKYRKNYRPFLNRYEVHNYLDYDGTRMDGRDLSSSLKSLHEKGYIKREQVGANIRVSLI